MAGSGGNSMGQAPRAAGVAAALCFVLALAGFGAALEGYGQLEYPVALLGADGIPRATAFNALAFVLPGLLAAFVALHRRGALPAGTPAAARLGWTMALLSALAFAAQGLLPLDARENDGGPGLHGVAWGVWAIAFAAASAALWLGALRARRPGAAGLHGAACALVFVFAWVPMDAVPLALAQRVAFAAWLAWVAWSGWAGPQPRWRASMPLR